ncbi:MAG: alpha/beta hydrolase fold domain-containing protein [Pseudomonadota bacterium]
MRLPLWLVNLGLRVFVRWPLGWIKTPQDLRARFARDAQLVFAMPDDAHFTPEALRRDDAPPMEMLWASQGRADRHRVILYLHGGAYLVGSPDTHRHLGAALAGAAGTRALLPGYRLAPEDPFPAAVEDALAAYRYLLETHEPGQIAFAGDSAGGGLVFALLLAAAQAGLPPPAAAVGFSPFTDLTLQAPSHRRNARREVMLPPQRAQEAVDYYLQGHDPRDPLASPAFGTFETPPASMILASTTEILADHATLLAETLRRFSGDVRLEIWPGLPHAWPMFVGRLTAADQATAEAGRFIQRAMDRQADAVVEDTG